MSKLAATATIVAVLGLSAASALPAAARADATGGTAAPGASPAGSTTGSSASGSGEAGQGGTAVDTSGGRLTASAGALLGRWQKVAGTLAGAPSGTTVLLQRTDSRTGWATVARAQTGPGGAFAARWRPDRAGRLTLRALAAARSAGARAAATPTTATTVYAAAIATQFGPGFYDQRTACGVLLTPRTIGVANTTLPCGTLVEFYFRGRTVRAPVIDRGPYANGASWDLTTGAAAALQFDGLAYVGSLTVGRVRLTG
jgi:rare lipoprotein A